MAFFELTALKELGQHEFAMEDFDWADGHGGIKEMDGMKGLSPDAAAFVPRGGYGGTSATEAPGRPRGG